MDILVFTQLADIKKKYKYFKASRKRIPLKIKFFKKKKNLYFRKKNKIQHQIIKKIKGSSEQILSLSQRKENELWFLTHQKYYQKVATKTTFYRFLRKKKKKKLKVKRT